MGFRILGIGMCLSAMFWVIGCGGGKKGKFTEEQMRTIPLANRYDLPAASGGMVMKLYSEMITSEEILLAVEERLKPAAAQMDQPTFVRETLPMIQKTIRSKVADIVVYGEARKKAPDNIDDALDKAIDQEISQFIASYGNNYALAEAQIRKGGMDWQTFREFQKKMIMTQSYLSSKLNEKRQFTHSEMVAHYEAVRDEQFTRKGKLEFRVIDIVPGLLEADRISEGQTAQEAAVELAAALAARARGGEDFAELAKTYSHGPLAPFGGKLEPVTIGINALPQPYDILEAAALKLEPGQVSEPIVGAEHIFVLKLEAKDLGGCKSFQEVQPLVERQLTFQHHQELYEKHVETLIGQANLVEMDQFAVFCANSAYNRWKKAE